MVPMFKPTTSWSLAVCLNHLTMALIKWKTQFGLRYNMLIEITLQMAQSDHIKQRLDQEWATSGPRAGSGPPSILIRPTYCGHYQ